MAESKHTPGPWEWDAGVIPPDGPGRYADIYKDGGDLIIASFNDLIPEGRANARLIAAAPDGLAAAKDALAGWRYIREHHGDLYGVGWDRVENALSAFIAKADPSPLNPTQEKGEDRG